MRIAGVCGRGTEIYHTHTLGELDTEIFFVFFFLV